MGNRVCLMLFLLLSAVSLKGGPLYTVEILGSLGAGAALPTGINNSGNAVGWITDSQGNVNPVQFLNGQATALGLGGQANAINNNGIAVGTQFSGGSPGVTEWAAGQSASLGIAGYGTAINDAGQVAGGYIRPDGQLHAFSWSGGVLVDLGTLGGSSSSAYGINATGETAGASITAGGRFHAFFSNGGTLQDLGTLGGANSYGMALNDAGQVAGNAQTGAGYMTAFLWDGQQMKGLGTLGGTQSYAYGINSAGDVVGYSWTSDGVTHGFLYRGGMMLDLNSLLEIGSGWTIDGAYGINEAGQILTQATYQGEHYAVDLNPTLATPEPAAFALVLLGLITVTGMRRGR
jgi:probable HAF family extracellular repeat protein